MHRWTFLLWAVLPLVFASPALAGATRSQEERAARKACLAGDYAKGISILSDLFVDTRDPTYIYNQGRCLEQNGRFADAIFRFQEYLRVDTRLTDADRAETNKHIKDCQEQVAKVDTQATPQAAPAGPTTAPPNPGPPAAPPPALVPPVVATAARAEAQPASAGAGLRTAGIVTAATGGAALVAGILFNWKANSIADSYQDRGGYSGGKESDRKTYEALGWVGYGLGAACVATGAVLYFFGRATRADASGLVVQPAVGYGDLGAVLKGSF